MIRLILRSCTAGFFLLAAAMLYLQYHVPMQWPSVPGRVEFADVVPADGNSGSGGPGTRYVPAVVYSYEVSDRQYEASSVAPFRWIYRNRERAMGSLLEEGIRAGARVEVYYNPGEPAEAVLVRALPWHRWDVRLAFLVLVVLPILVVAYTVRDYLRGGESRRNDTSRGRFW